MSSFYCKARLSHTTITADADADAADAGDADADAGDAEEMQNQMYHVAGRVQQGNQHAT
jgi:hypothetical protein